MLGWLKRKRPTPAAREEAPADDAVLGALPWDARERAWVAHLPHARSPFRILLAGAERPDARLVRHARDIFAAPDELLAEAEQAIGRAAREIPEAAEEILGLRIESVALMWPERPDDGMIYFDGPGTDERVWRCDYVGRRVMDLGFDD